MTPNKATLTIIFIFFICLSANSIMQNQVSELMDQEEYLTGDATRSTRRGTRSLAVTSVQLAPVIDVPKTCQIGSLEKDSCIVQIPFTSTFYPSCIDTKSIGRCVNELIERKDTDPLTILIPEGRHSLKETIFIYQRSDIEIKGTGKDKTILVVDDTLQRSGIGIERFFFINIINSKKIYIHSMGLDANLLSGQRGIGVCPLGDSTVEKITLSDLHLQNIKSFAVIVGNAYIDHIQNGFLSEEVGPKRLSSDLKENDLSEMLCSGKVKNIIFEDNTLDIHNTGFYLIPHTSEKTKNLKTQFDDWYGHASKISEANTGIVIKGNTFTAMSDSVPNAMKLAHSNGMIIEDNLIITSFPKSFSKGAAINLAMNNKDTTIVTNKIIFPIGHRYKDRAINIHSYFSKHAFYGIGEMLIAPPSLGVKIENNEFINSKVRVFDCCLSEFAKFCDEFDNHQILGDEQYEGISLSGNKFEGLSKDEGYVNILSKSGARSLLEQLHCRKNTQVFIS